jgi:small subunit ribosomal protein S9
MATQEYYATGKRKNAIARVWISSGTGEISINRKSLDEYFGNIFFAPKVERPLNITETGDRLNIRATVKGGGKSAQVDALVHGITRALQEMDPEMRTPLKKAGLLTRDPRVKERKKYGQRGARARFQFSKR